MNSFITNLYQELIVDTEIELLYFETFAGLSAAEIDQLADRHGRPLDEKLTEFYQESNGLQVCWVSSEGRNTNDSSAYPKAPVEWGYWKSDYHYLDGVIQLLPLEELLTQQGRNRWWFETEASYEATLGNEVVNSLAVKKQSLLWDVFDMFYTTALYWPSAESSPKVLLSQDHEADFFTFLPLTPQAYFELLRQTKGAVEGRALMWPKASSSLL